MTSGSRKNAAKGNFFHRCPTFPITNRDRYLFIWSGAGLVTQRIDHLVVRSNEPQPCDDQLKSNLRNLKRMIDTDFRKSHERSVFFHETPVFHHEAICLVQIPQSGNDGERIIRP